MEVSELKASFDAFAGGQLTFEALSEALERAVSVSPNDRAEVLGLIEEHKGRGLFDDSQYAVLLGLVSHGSAVDFESDQTVIIPGGTGGGTPPEPTGAPPAAFDADKTVILGVVEEYG